MTQAVKPPPIPSPISLPLNIHPSIPSLQPRIPCSIKPQAHLPTYKPTIHKKNNPLINPFLIHEPYFFSQKQKSPPPP